MKYKLPDDFGIETYILEECIRCKEVDEKLKLGIKIWTPYSYFLIEGCNDEKSCYAKTFQLLYFGLGLDLDTIGSFVSYGWDILNGQEKIETIERFISQIKVLLGYFPEKIASYRRNIPEVIEILSVGMIFGKIPGWMAYPLTKVSVGEFEEDPVSGELRAVEHFLKIPGERACRLVIEYPTRNTFFGVSNLILLENHGSIRVYRSTFFHSHPEQNREADAVKATDLIRSWLYFANKIKMNKISSKEITKYIRVGNLISELIRRFSLFEE